MKSTSPPAGKGPHRDPAKERSWRRLLKQFAASGQNVCEFCAARQLTETAFYFWRREIQRRDGHAPARSQPSQRATSASIAFAKVQVQPPRTIPEPSILRLRLAGGRELLLPASWTIPQLAALIRAIEDAA